MHKPVLLNEVIELLAPRTGENFIDGTFGGGGHSELIWQKIKPNGRLLALDWNKKSVENCHQKYGNATSLFCQEGNFADLPAILKKRQFPPADGLLLDLGLSSDELECSGRGFSFQRDREDEPLLMTYNDNLKPVKDVIAEIGEKELADIIKDYGEERFAKRIARSIKGEGSIKPIITAKDLVRAIVKAVPKNYERGRLHPATRTFMALRIYANHELENLKAILNNLENIMAPRSRVAIISFHSLEDRIVKLAFKKMNQENKVEILTKKPIAPTREEIRKNSRSRSAKLRAIKFL